MKNTLSFIAVALGSLVAFAERVPDRDAGERFSIVTAEAVTPGRAGDKSKPGEGTSGRFYERGLLLRTVTQVYAANGKRVGQEFTSTLKVKGRKGRADSIDLSAIYDGSTGENIFIFHDTRTYRRQTARQRKEAARKEPAALVPDRARKKPRPIGKTRKVGDYIAHGYTEPDPFGGPDGTIWVVKEFPHFNEIMERLKNAQDETSIWNHPETLPPGFVVRSERPAEEGGHIVTTQSVRAEAIDDSVFRIPEEYTEQVAERRDDKGRLEEPGEI